MLSQRRIQTTKWTGSALAVLLLSQSFARWRDFHAEPSIATYAAILLVLSLFLVLMSTLAVVVYAEEKCRGRITRNRPFFDRWSDRLFLKHDVR